MQDAVDGKLKGADTGFIMAHLQECAACREDYRQTSNMLEMLRGIPVSPPSSRPATAGSRFKHVTGGIAASLVAVFLTVSVITGPWPGQQDPDIMLIGGEVKTVRVAIDSPRVVEGITVTINVSDNLEIEGYGKQQAISWTTRLEQGINLIALPVNAIAAGDGEIVARVGLDGHEKVYRIRTRYQAAGNVSNDYKTLAASPTVRHGVPL
jgi:hypothetical protein